MPSNQEIKQQIIRVFYLPLLLLFVIWSIKGIEILGDTSFYRLGIHPREISGLIGIIMAPLIHGDFNHLINNSVPLVVLTTAILYFYRPIAYKVIALMWVITGFCVWLGAISSGYHIGASGVIYAEAAFLFFSGVLRKNMKLLAISLLVIFLYGSMVWGIFPIDLTISWESHLFGGLTGMVFAFIYAHQGPKNEVIVWEDDDNEYPYWEQTDENDPENNDTSPSPKSGT
jgi:membrane associated rhomboid family serine protease